MKANGLSKLLRFLDLTLLLAPFPHVIVWWMFLGGLIGAVIVGPYYSASWFMIPVVAVGLWRAILRHKKTVAAEKKSLESLKK